MIKIRNLLQKILIVIFALFIAMPGFAASDDIGDYGVWATEANQTQVNNVISDELQHFAPTETTVSNGFVPIEAKLGLAFMGGLSKLGTALDSSLVRFAMIFMLLSYAFWLAFEAYNLIGSGADAKKVVHDILIKGIWISVWLIILDIGIAKTFTMIMTPIISVGTMMSGFILESVTSLANIDMSKNTCDAIRQYAATNSITGLQISMESAADLLCVPSQMSGFFVTTISIGWNWIFRSVGFSMFAAILGIFITYLSLKCIWKYIFISLGIVADLFLALLLLPFTAIAETTAKTQYKGVAGDIFNSFLSIFKTESLETQINRFIKVALYFVCLSIAIGVSVSLLAFIIDPTTGRVSSNMDMSNFGGVIILILSLMLVNYMADKAKSLAEDWGGKIDSGFGEKVKNDVTTLWTLSKKRWNQTRELLKKK